MRLFLFFEKGIPNLLIALIYGGGIPYYKKHRGYKSGLKKSYTKLYNMWGMNAVTCKKEST